MKQLKKIGLFLITSLTLISCNVDDGVNTNALPLQETLNNLFKASLNSKMQVAEFDASTNYVFTSSKGVKVTINGGCLRKNGVLVTGPVKLEYIELFGKGDMLSTNKATMGKTAAGEDRLLVSGGEFFTRVTQDGVELTTDCGVSFLIPTALTGGTDNTMLPFNGTTDANGNITWDQSTTSDLAVVQDQASSISFYNAFNGSFGWFNCDRFADYTGAKTTITTYVPSGYGSVSHIFVVTKNVPNSLGKAFGEFPVGLECSLVFVTEKDGKYRYAIKPTTPLVANHTVTFTLAETTIGTQAQLTAAINAIP
jgi:hypothetical protein